MTIRRYFLIFMLYAVLVPTTQANDSGGIKGQVEFCDQGGLDGMMVYISGKQFNVITDASGKFEFSLLPAGTYDLYYRYKGKRLNYNRGIVVNKNTITDLSVIAMCDPSIHPTGAAAPSVSPEPKTADTEQLDPTTTVTTSAATSANTGNSSEDKDADGFPVAQDCNDNDAMIRPGALELCDGKDNNCNGMIDENDNYPLSKGSGSCVAGVISVASCKKGYANCDGDSKNGCEADLNSDGENCGSCGNLCSEAEYCAQGMC